MKKLKIDITPSLQRLDLITKGLVNTKFMGDYASVFKGHGLEFESYRVYSPSDDASLIDWTASNRSRKLLIKEFVEERNISVFFLIDVSSKMLLGSTQKLKCEYAAELVSSFSHTILKTGDFVGVTLFSDKIMKRIPPITGMKQFQIISEALSNLSYYGGGSNIKKVLEHALKNFDNNSLVILISDFINPENYLEELKFAAVKFDLIGMMIRDPIDVELPDGEGQVLIEDSATGERMLISPAKYKSIYAREAKKEISKINHTFRNIGADFLYLNTNKSFIEELVMFFQRRKMAWR